MNFTTGPIFAAGTIDINHSKSSKVPQGVYVDGGASRCQWGASPSQWAASASSVFLPWAAIAAAFIAFIILRSSTLRKEALGKGEWRFVKNMQSFPDTGTTRVYFTPSTQDTKLGPGDVAYFGLPHAPVLHPVPLLRGATGDLSVLVPTNIVFAEQQTECHTRAIVRIVPGALQIPIGVTPHIAIYAHEIGIANALSILKAAMRCAPQVRTVMFLWTVTSPQLRRCFADDLNHLQENGDGKPTLTVFVVGTQQQQPSSTEQCAAFMERFATTAANGGGGSLYVRAVHGGVEKKLVVSEALRMNLAVDVDAS